MPVRTRSPLRIPTDVTDEQKYWYFGPQKRWFLVLRFLTFIGLLVSLTRFGLGDPHVGVILLVVLLMAAVSVAGLYASTRRRTSNQIDHEQRVLSWSPLRPPSVDVFLPCAGEAVHVLDNTYRHVSALLYPGIVSVYVLDDGGREDVKALASQYGFRYLSRPDRGRLKKAGNLAYGLGESASDAITILDADFAPRPEYLLELMPYLDDPRVGIVQSPQFFDTHVGGPWLQRAAGADQELFYRWFQPSLDAVGAPICVGTCAIYRRSALARVGGFAQIPHSEDIHTGIALMGEGYEIRYVPVILAKGLCPESMAPYVSQQYRWCSGSLTLMTSAEFRSMALSWRQRVCYWSGFGYYIATAVVAFVAFLPPIYLLWARPGAIQDRDFLLLLPVVLAYPLIAVLSRSRWEFGVLRAQVAQSFAHAVAIWDAWRGHTEEWVATGTAPRTALGNRVGRLMAGWLIIIQVGLWSGIAHDLSAHRLSLGDTYPLILFAVFAAYLHTPLMLEVFRKPMMPTHIPAAGVAHMSIEVSPPFILPAPARPDAHGATARRHASPPPRTTTRADALLNRMVASQTLWLTPVLLLQAVLCFRLTNGLEVDEAQSLNAGHQIIAHLLHGAPTPAFGRYFGGVPALYAVPAAMLDHLGGPDLVRAVNTLLVLGATVLVYLTVRRIFGQGAAIIAAGVFALNPTSIFVARFASADAPCLLLFTCALFLATKSFQERRDPFLAGSLFATAVALKYLAILFVPGALLVALGVTAQQIGIHRAWRATATTAAATVGLLGVWAAVAHHDLGGFTSTALGGHTIDEIAGTTLLHDGWDYVGVIAASSVIATIALRGRRITAGLMCIAGLAPVAIQIGYHESASLHRSVGLCMIFLAPVLGALGASLLRQGKLLGLRAPLAFVGAVVLLSSGMGTSAKMIHAWPTSTSINNALRYYAHDGTARYLVDGSDLPAYYLSDVTNYNQWASTLDERYAAAGGAQRLRGDLQSGDFRLVLYRNDGATPALDRSMLATLRTRYTLVARVPVSNENNHAYWSLWLAGATSMTPQQFSARAIRLGIAAAVLVALPACAAGRDARVSTFQPRAASHHPVTVDKAAVLHPKRKYYGVFTPTAPADMSSINTITDEVGKQPNLSLYFQSWGANSINGIPNFSVKTAENACGAGLLPLYTWESWDTMDKDSTGTPVWSQPQFAPSRIAAGDFDAYIKATAQRIASLPCPIAIRFDQEFNGYWYPWGLDTAGMPGTQSQRAADYIAMWRHVWKIFHKQGVTNAVWVWSPNIQSKQHPTYPDFSLSYPGGKYVDWVGLDGYYYSKTDDNQSFKDVFGPSMRQLQTVVPHKPWIIAETGVAAGPNKATQITDLINSVSSNDQLNGFVYFNEFKAYDRSDWRFDADSASLDAFSDAVGSHVYANGKPGSL